MDTEARFKNCNYCYNDDEEETVLIVIGHLPAVFIRAVPANMLVHRDRRTGKYYNY